MRAFSFHPPIQSLEKVRFVPHKSATRVLQRNVNFLTGDGEAWLGRSLEAQIAEKAKEWEKGKANEIVTKAKTRSTYCRNTHVNSLTWHHGTLLSRAWLCHRGKATQRNVTTAQHYCVIAWVHYTLN